jgi:hypothetical protein
MTAVALHSLQAEYAMELRTLLRAENMEAPTRQLLMRMPMG